MLGEAGHGWQLGASETHYRVAPPSAMFERVDNNAGWKVERRGKHENVLKSWTEKKKISKMSDKMT